ncbi:toxin biosynthesis protein [Botryosphaeria dothidea]|uniref:Toxin biosynthesis protein n=1 Tax=Botryosphaeria dothidea TaxID=55169 RepID=A0A8H4N8S6_9PEZI|nr:toxin biosynthesis protein [Botryosphaeria dothidea]
MGGDPRRPAHEGQKDASAPLPSPTSGLLSPQEDTARPDTLYTVLSDCHEQGASGQRKDHLYGNLDGHVAVRGGNSARGTSARLIFPGLMCGELSWVVETDSQARAETGERRQSAEISLNSAHAESPTPFVDLHLGMLDGMHLLRTPNETFSFTGGRSQRQDSTADWCDFDRGSHSPRSTSDDEPSTVGDAAFEPTLEGRIEYLIGCAHKAGFQDLDSVMIAFYTATFDEGSGCSIAQHLSRKRCLPKLLEELRSHAGSWGSWEVRAYQDEILRSAESLLLAEMGSTAPASGDRDGNWSVVSHQLRNEMPHL